MYFYPDLTLWGVCCCVRQRRKNEQEALRESPSLYVIPLNEEDMYGLPYRQSTVHCSQQETGLPPPYMPESPSYRDAAPPSYADLYSDSTGGTVT